MPDVSVVVPLYNKAPFVERCVASIRAQTLSNFEVLVVDDGSTDTSLADVHRACSGDARFRVLTQPNGGVSRARNTGIGQARSELVAFLDADDEWRPGYLEAIVATARSHPGAVVVGTAYEIMQAGIGLHTRMGMFGGAAEVPIEGFFEAWSRLGGCPLFVGATAARRADLLAVGGFESGMNLGEELLAFIRLMERGPLAFDDRIMAVYHLSGAGSLATSPSVAAIANHRKLLAELERQVTLGRCPAAVYRRWMGIHAGYLMQSGQRAELLQLFLESPAQFRARQWMAALLEVVGARGALRRFIGRA